MKRKLIIAIIPLMIVAAAVFFVHHKQANRVTLDDLRATAQPQGLLPLTFKDCSKFCFGCVCYNYDERNSNYAEVVYDGGSKEDDEPKECSKCYN